MQHTEQHMWHNFTEFKTAQVNSLNDPERLEIVSGNMHETNYKK